MSSFDEYLSQVGEIGHVVAVSGVLVTCSGLLGAKIGEKVVFENEAVGVVNAIWEKSTQVLLLDWRVVNAQTMVVRTSEVLGVGVSESLLGRILDPFGRPIDGRGKIKKVRLRRFESSAPPLIDRVRVNEQLETGVMLVDLLIPLGHGQRELVIGDQKTGRTSFLIQAMARQAQLGTICIYTLIGKRKSDLSTTIEKLHKFGARDRTIVVAAPASLATSLIYLAPFCAFSIAEYFRDLGHNVLVVFDELSRHAKYYRELSILSKKMPGREGYPGDIFHMHAHLLERAGRAVVAKGGGREETLTLKIKGKTAAITTLAVVDAYGGDFTGYIQTNLMAMTDGHIFYDINLYQEGIRPAINTQLSVTRVGRQTQTTVERDFSREIRQMMFDYTQARDVAKFGVELLATTQVKLVNGEKVYALLAQENDVIIPKIIQLLYVALLLSGFWENSTPLQIKEHKDAILFAYHEGQIAEVSRELARSLEMGSKKRFMDVVAKHQARIAKICKL